jgi:glycosyltransferase involved in cell wall biosynthesis
MKIGIDISQTAYEGTGVANYVQNLVNALIALDTDDEYVLFYSSMRRNFPSSIFHFPFTNNKVTVKSFRIPPTFLDLIWNRLHIFPIENFIGDVDVFISSDWTQPPLKHAKGVSILYDLIVFKHPEETAESIVTTQKRRMRWMKKECERIICISESTKKDAKEILGIDEKRLTVVYPGMTL